MISMTSVTSKARTHARGLACAALLGLASCLHAAPLGAQSNQDEPSIEAMRAVAREKVKEQSAFIKTRVVQAVTVFQGADSVPDRKLADEHEALVELGLGVIPPLIETLLKTESASVLDQIGILLVRLVSEKRATLAEVAGPVRDLLDQTDAARAAAAAKILGWLGDKNSLDAIRLLISREEPQVRAAVIESRARLGDKSVREQFESGMRNESPLVRIAVLRALRLIGDNGDVPLILAGLEDKDVDVAIAAIWAIEGVSTNSKAMSALHDQLSAADDTRIRVAIEVIVRIGNKGYSAKHLGALVGTETRVYDLRLQAAKAMFKLGSSDGMEALAQPLEGIIKNNPKDARNYQQLAEFYADFGAWDDAAKTYAKAIDLVKSSARQNELRLDGARCWARAGQFKRASAMLKKMTFGDDWSSLAEDPAFEKMKEDRRYSSHFN